MMRARLQSPKRLAGDERGAAAAEFALWVALLVPVLASGTDLGLYVFTRMQVAEAAQVAAQTAWQTCSWVMAPGNLPAAGPCASSQSLVSKLNTALQSTGLGTNVTLAKSYEGYYCVNDSDALQMVGTQGVIPPSGAATAPTGSGSTCSADGAAFTGNSAAPGDYVQINVTYTYTPLFGAASIVALLPKTITETAWTRLN